MRHQVSISKLCSEWGNAFLYVDNYHPFAVAVGGEKHLTFLAENENDFYLIQFCDKDEAKKWLKNEKKTRKWNKIKRLK